MAELIKYFKKKFIIVILIAGIVFPIAASSAYSGKDEKRAFNQCKKLIHERLWSRAASCCSTFVIKHPNSPFVDDALFWQGFSLEQSKKHDKEALQIFQTLISNYPGSSWTDDASIHTIILAKRLYKKNKQYLNKIYPFLSSRDSTIQFQAALALSELKDKRAIPVLEQFVHSDNNETAKLALEAIQLFSKDIEKSAHIPDQDFNREDSSVESSTHKNDLTIIAEGLKRKGSDWTEKELFLNGLYHIVPRKDLAFFLSLENQWDKKEWLRKFWARLDPTPTTKENEAREEFRRRVLYSYDNFGMKEQTNKGFYPPWDSRGEVYIKFGKPDKIVKISKNRETWTYYNYRIIFTVTAKRNNSDNKGIRLSIISRYIYRHNLIVKEIRFLKTPKFFFTTDMFKKSGRIKRFNLFVKQTKSRGNKVLVNFNFSFPAWNLKYIKDNRGNISGSYFYRWVIYDNDYKIIQLFEKLNNLKYINKKGFDSKEISGDISVMLEPGSYLLALRIEDPNSSRIGIFTKKFTIEKK